MWITSVRRRLKSCFFPATFVPNNMRKTIASCVFPITMAEVVLFGQLQLGVRYGDLPWYMTDLVIMIVAAIEALVSPVLSWLGYKRRRTVLMTSTLIAGCMMLILFAMPAVSTAIGSELCRGSNNWVPFGLTTPSVLRLAIIIIVAMTMSFARSTIISHGVGYMAEHSLSGMVMTTGLLTMVRVLGLALFRRFHKVTMPMWMQILAVTPPLIVSTVELYRYPAMPPLADGEKRIPSDGRGFFSSIKRVLTNKLVMAETFAVALLGAAFWGFVYHQEDIAKTQYLTMLSDSFIDQAADIMRYHVIFFAVIVVGILYAVPAMPVFKPAVAAKWAMILSGLSIIVYIGNVTALRCDTGTVAGLSGNSYSQPGCSSQCGCTPALNQLSPICIVNQMTTYLSPCHAGCSSSETFGGATFLGNCTCGEGRALPGICNQIPCRNTFEYYKMLCVIIMLSTIVVTQLHLTLLVRASDPRDRSIVVGVAFTIITLIIFFCGHGAYLAIRAMTCVWSEEGSCRLHKSSFPYIVGGTSAGLTLVSLCITFFVWLMFRRQKNPIEDTVDHEM